MNKNNLLEREDYEVFTRRHWVSTFSHTSGSALMPWKIEVQADALAQLVSDVSVGMRVYELLSITRPGELLAYVYLEFDPADVELQQELQSRLGRFGSRRWELGITDEEPIEKIIFSSFERMYPLEPSSDSNLHGSWQLSRNCSSFWKDYLSDLFSRVKSVQNRTLLSPDPLIQAAMKLMNENRHPQQLDQHIERRASLHAPKPYIKMPPALVERLVTLVDIYQVRSVCAEEGGYVFWYEMLKRQLAVGTSNLELRCGCDAPKPPYKASHVGGEINNGVQAELMVIPAWKTLCADACEKEQRLPYTAKILVSERDWSGMTFVDHEHIEGWNIYIDRSWRQSKESFQMPVRRANPDHVKDQLAHWKKHPPTKRQK